MAATTSETALAIASGDATPVRAAIVAGEALRTVGAGVGARGGGGGFGKGGLLITPASFSPDTALIISTKDV